MLWSVLLTLSWLVEKYSLFEVATITDMFLTYAHEVSACRYGKGGSICIFGAVTTLTAIDLDGLLSLLLTRQRFCHRLYADDCLREMGAYPCQGNVVLLARIALWWGCILRRRVLHVLWNLAQILSRLQGR